MDDKDNIALSVRDLKTFFYTNNRCNKAVNGVSFDVEKAKHFVSLVKVGVEKVLQPQQLCSYFQLCHELKKVKLNFEGQ